MSDAIYGIGTDLIRITRIDKVYRRHPERFPRRLLHPREYAQFQQSARPINFLAKSWAAKEAFGKALGTGVRNYDNPEVGVVRGELGRPFIVMSARMRQRLNDLGVSSAHLSLSDEGGMVMAFVVLERGMLNPPLQSA